MANLIVLPEFVLSDKVLSKGSYVFSGAGLLHLLFKVLELAFVVFFDYGLVYFLVVLHETEELGIAHGLHSLLEVLQHCLLLDDGVCQLT